MPFDSLRKGRSKHGLPKVPILSAGKSRENITNYILNPQFSSLVTDLYMSFYSPFVMLNCRVMYSISTLAGAMQASTGLVRLQMMNANED